MVEYPLASYPLMLLKLIGEQDGATRNPPLGTSTRVGIEDSKFNVATHRLLKAVIEYSPSPVVVAQEFLVELGKCGILAVKEFVDTLSSARTLSPDDWAAMVHQEIKTHGGDLSYLTVLGSHYFSHLVIAFRNPGGKNTPQDSIHPSPDLTCIQEINDLLRRATVHRSQGALRDLVFHRDGFNCLVTHAPFTGNGAVIPRCAHIIPFSIHSKSQTHRVIETFTGTVLKAEDIQQYVNHPCNALNLQTDAHDSMDKHLAWGIEAKLCDDQWKYFFRIVRTEKIPFLVKLEDGDEITFGMGDNSGGIGIAAPDPRICNLHLAIARVTNASGAAEVFDEFLDDDDDCHGDGWQLPIYFGSPFVSDDALMRRLEVLAS